MTLRLSELADVERVEYDEFFLVEDLLTSRITYLTGEPKAGKSLLAVSLVRACLEGESRFLGQRVLRRLSKVVWGFTDDGADAELRERLHGTDALSKVLVLPVHDLSDDDWAALPNHLAEAGCELFVLDTVLGSLGPSEDIASGVVGMAVNVRLRRIAEAGISVLAITHTPKGAGEGLTTASSVIGSRAMAAGGRGVIALRRRQNGGRRILTSINRAREDLDLRVIVEPQCEGSEVPRWRVATGSPRLAGRDDWRDHLAEAVMLDQPEVTSSMEIGRIYAAQVGVSPSTVRQAVPTLLEHDGTGWRRKAA